MPIIPVSEKKKLWSVLFRIVVSVPQEFTLGTNMINYFIKDNSSSIISKVGMFAEDSLHISSHNKIFTMATQYLAIGRIPFAPHKHKVMTTFNK